MLAQALETQGQTVAAQLDEWLAGDDYLRAAQAQQVREQLDELARRALPATGELTLRQLSPESQEAFARLQELTAEHGTEQARRVASDTSSGNWSAPPKRWRVRADFVRFPNRPKRWRRMKT
jgi:uncharacterized iron-regulated membrane protein